MGAFSLDVELLDISRFWGVVKTVIRREMAVSSGVAACLRRGIVSNVMSSTRLNANHFLANMRNKSESFDRLRTGSAGGVLGFVMVFSFLQLM